MHLEAFEGFGWALERAGVNRHEPLDVLDLGGQNVNGTVHDWFTHPETQVITLDLENADIIADATTWRPPENGFRFDVVIATEVFEHVQDWPAVIRTAYASLKPDGVFITTYASTGRQPHGATGAPSPASGEWYQNVPVDEVELHSYAAGFPSVGSWFRRLPGDGYTWAARSLPEHHITVVIPTLPSRLQMVDRAIESVRAQTLPNITLEVMTDQHGEGPAVIRNRIIEDVGTEWITFLDDDDEMHPTHLETLARAQQATNADVVWPWFTVNGGTDPFPKHRGRQWDPDDPHIFPITTLVRTSLFRKVGGFSNGHRVTPDGRVVSGEDWRLWNALSAAGARFHHVNEVTWTWTHHSGNTSGRPR